MQRTRSSLLRPALSSRYGLLLGGILLTPLFGIGLLLVWIAVRKRNNTIYEVFDHEIVFRLPEQTSRVALADIEEVRIRQNRVDAFLNIGTIELVTGEGTYSLQGLKQPRQPADLLRHAAKAERKRRERIRDIQARTPDQSPGTLEKLNDLTGLWQQGLLTDEEYQKERKHFE